MRVLLTVLKHDHMKLMKQLKDEKRCDNYSEFKNIKHNDD